MTTSMASRHERELVRGMIEERPARCGQDQRLDRRHRLTDETLPERRVLGIDRSDPGKRAREGIGRPPLGYRGSESASLRHHQVAAGDQRLLVGHRDDLAGLERGQNGP
jgi:hypothetical protein